MLVGARLRSDECDGPIVGRTPAFGSPFHAPRRAGGQSGGNLGIQGPALLLTKVGVVFA
jgi:hypothetical protein